MTTASFDLSELNGKTGFVLNGINENDFAGNDVSGAGDVNGDGFDDLIINASGAGQSYVVFGSDREFEVSLDLSSLDGSNGFTLNGGANSVSLVAKETILSVLWRVMIV